jgi:hypothetical protein
MDRVKGDVAVAGRLQAACDGRSQDARETLPIGPSAKLAALTSGALALPGMLAGPAGADSPVQEPSADYSFSYYKEDNLSPGLWNEDLGGSRNRYEIFAHQFSLIAPVTSRIDTRVDLVFETMSGASPWWVTWDQGQQKYLQVMSGATIFEQRVDGQIGVNHYFDRGRIGLTGGVSSEKDYLSGNFGFDIERSFNDKNTVLNVGLGFSWDTITPTDPAQHDDLGLGVYYKKAQAFNLTLSQILYRDAILQAGLAYKHGDGYLSDPYKRVEVSNDGTTVDDRRPSERHQLTPFARYRHFIRPANASLHVDVAGQWDSWSVSSFTAEVAWYQTLFERFELIPSFRYYSQSQADFYGPVFRFGIPTYRTSDYRLSPFGAISYGLRANAHLDGWPDRDLSWILSLAYQRYRTSADWAISDVELANPGLVEYHLFSVLLGAKF